MNGVELSKFSNVRKACFVSPSILCSISMIDHFNIPVRDIEKSLHLYRQILKSLDIKCLFHDQDAYGFGVDYWEFGIYQSDEIITPLHLAFTAPDSDSVVKFYDIAISIGARPNGKPGLRKEYGSNYYAAYILDFDNYNVEAVCRE